MLAALMVASLSKNLAEFLLFSVLIGVTTFAASRTAMPLQATPSVRLSRDLLSHAIQLIAMAGVLVQQFIQRRASQRWCAIVLALVAVVAVRLWWPWDVSAPLVAATSRGQSVERAEDRLVEIQVDQTLTKFRSNAMPTLFVHTPWTSDRFYVPALARFSDGRLAAGGQGSGNREIGLRALGLANDGKPLRWQLMIPQLSRAKGDDVQLAGRLEVWSARARVVGEMPILEDARISEGANRTRILSVERKDDRLDGILLEERDSTWGDIAGGTSRQPAIQSALLASQRRYFDRYFLVDRARKTAQLVTSSALGSIELNSVVIRYRRLHIYGTGDWKEGVVLKLRIECDHRFERPFEVKGVTLVSPVARP